MTFESNLVVIKELLQSITRQLDSTTKVTNDVKAAANKLYSQVTNTATTQDNRAPVERFYVIYLICQFCADAKQNKVEKLMKLLLPTPPTTQSMELISDLINLALCHPSVYHSLLDYMGSFLHASDLVNVDVESWYQAESLALDSPSFCSALIGRADLPKLGIDKKLLAQWLQELARIEQDFPPCSLNQLIRYSLLSQATAPTISHEEELVNSDLHFGILTLIQSGRCSNLTNQFLIDLVSNLATCDKQKPETALVVDRFAQILAVAAASKMTTITNALKNALAKLDSNQLIASIIQK